MSNDTSHNQTYPKPPHEGDSSWVPVRKFLSYFHGSILCYIPDAESLKSLPVTHSDVLDLEKQEQGYGVFYSVNGFKSSRSRKLDNLLSLNAFCVDVDWPKRLGKPTPDQLASFKSDVLQDFLTLEADGFLPSFIIETKNGLHALWLFDEPIIFDNLKEETKPKLLKAYADVELAIVDRFQGDPLAKDINRVLRLPNTWHLKNPKAPFRVRLVQMSEITYAFKTLKNYFLNHLGRDAETGKVGTESNGETSDIRELAWRFAKNREPLDPAVFDELKKRYPKTERPSIQSLMAKDGITEGSRNHSLLIAASAMRESGMSEADVLGYFDHYNGLSAYEIAHTIRSAFKSPTPLSFGWNHPLVHVSEAEKAKVSAVLGTILNERRAVKLQTTLVKSKVEELARDPDQPKSYVPVIHKIEPDEKERMKRMVEKRTDAQQKAFEKNLYASYERVIIERHPRLRYCLTDQQFYDFESGVYKLKKLDDVNSLILQEMESDDLKDYRTVTHIKNKIACLKSLKEIHVEMSDPSKDPATLNVMNGILDFTSGDLRPHTPDFFTTNQLPVRYHDGEPEKMAPRWVSFVNQIMLGDTGKIRFLQQMAGYCFTRSITHQKAFILYGTGANGKSTFVDVLQRILGPDNASSLTLAGLHKQFGLAQLFGKTMNVVEEISENSFESDMIKKVITGSEILADRKFMDHLSFRPYAKFVFAVNDLPRIKDTSTGLYRRFHIIDFLASFDEESADPELPDRLWEERDGIFLWCMKGWQDLVLSQGFIVPASIVAASDRFKEANSPLVEFLLRRYEIAEPERAMAFVIPLMHIFEAYQKEVRELGYQPKSYQNFCKELANLNHKGLKNVSVIPVNSTKMVAGLKLKPKPLLQPTTPSFQ